MRIDMNLIKSDMLFTRCNWDEKGRATNSEKKKRKKTLVRLRQRLQSKNTSSKDKVLCFQMGNTP